LGAGHADYKGEFLLGNRRYCYPLTITDFASRYLLACEALSTTKERYAFTVFERAFQEYGLGVSRGRRSSAGADSRMLDVSQPEEHSFHLT
jgi:hypothetical protein